MSNQCTKSGLEIIMDGEFQAVLALVNRTVLARRIPLTR